MEKLEKEEDITDQLEDLRDYGFNVEQLVEMLNDDDDEEDEEE